MSKIQYSVSLSGGQDSTAMLVRMLELNYPIKHIIFCNTKYEFPQMYEYINKLDNWLKEKYNKQITILEAEKGMRYWAFEYPIKSVKKKENEWKIGRLRGLPVKGGMDYCTRELKVNLINNFLKNEVDVIQCDGITITETNRGTNKEKFYPLIEWGWDEHIIQDYLKDNGLYNILYDFFYRTGCFLCPKQEIEAWYTLYYHFNDLFEEAKALEDEAKRLNCINQTFRDDYSLLELEERFKKYNHIPSAKTLFSWNDEDVSCFCK